MRRIFVLLACLVLVFSICPTAYADEPPPIEVSDYAFFASPQLLFLPQGADASTLSLPTDIVVQHAPYGRFNYLQGLSANWDLASFDATQTGRQSLTGTVSLPAGHAYFENGSEAPLLIQQPVWVHAPGMIEHITVLIDQGPVEAFQLPLVSLGTDSAALAALFDANCKDDMLLRTQDGLMFRSGFQIDQGLVDATASGTYFPFLPALPHGVHIDPLFLKGRCMAVVVVDPHKVDLSGILPDLATPFTVWGRWLQEAHAPEVWVTQDDPFCLEQQPVWQVVLGSIDLDSVRIHAFVTATYLDLEFRSLPFSSTDSPEGEFWFQIRHTDGVSNYLHLKIDEGLMFTHSRPPEGDRDGGDRTPNPGEGNTEGDGGNLGSGGDASGGGGDGGGDVSNPGGGNPGSGGGASNPGGGSAPGGNGGGGGGSAPGGNGGGGGTSNPGDGAPGGGSGGGTSNPGGGTLGSGTPGSGGAPSGSNAPSGGNTPSSSGGADSQLGAGGSTGGSNSGTGGGLGGYSGDGSTSGGAGSQGGAKAQGGGAGGLILESSNPLGSPDGLSGPSAAPPREAPLLPALPEPSLSSLAPLNLPMILTLAILVGVGGVSLLAYLSRRRKALLS